MPPALKLTSLLESARVGADSLRSNPLRTVLATTGVIIGVGSLVAAFAITDGVEVWSRALIARESSVQDVAVTARTQERVRGRSLPVRGYPELTLEDAQRAQAEVPGGLASAFAGTAVFRRVTGAGIWPVVHASTSLIAIGAAVVVGVVFGTYPARRAASLSPIEAIARE